MIMTVTRTITISSLLIILSQSERIRLPSRPHLLITSKTALQSRLANVIRPKILQNAKVFFFGDSYNIVANSVEKASDFIRSCKKPAGISAAGLKALMNELGDDVDYHLGNEFNIVLVDDDESDESDYIDTSFSEIE